MTVTVAPERDGPDYTGRVLVTFDQDSHTPEPCQVTVTLRSTPSDQYAALTIGPIAADELWGKLGGAIEKVKANFVPDTL